MNTAGASVLQPLGDASGGTGALMPATPAVPLTDDSGGKVGDLAMMLSILSSAVLIFRR